MPGTTSKTIPAATRAAISSSRRPNISASPALRRTTRRPGGGERHHQIVDVALLAGATVTLLADVDALRTRRRERQHLRRHELVVEDDIGLLQRAQRLQRQQLRVAGTGADQADATGLPAAAVTGVAAWLLRVGCRATARPACVTRYSAAATRCAERCETLSGCEGACMLASPKPARRVCAQPTPARARVAIR